MRGPGSHGDTLCMSNLRYVIFTGNDESRQQVGLLSELFSGRFLGGGIGQFLWDLCHFHHVTLANQLIANVFLFFWVGEGLMMLSM